MRLVQKSHRDRQAARVRQLGSGISLRFAMVAHSLDVGVRRSIPLRRSLGFERQEVDERPLRSRDLRRQSRLSPDERAAERVCSEAGRAGRGSRFDWAIGFGSTVERVAGQEFEWP